MMRQHLRLAVPGLLVALGAGCNDFLNAENAARNPNEPTEATRDQLFVAAQVAMFGLQEANVAQFSCVIIQHCAGTGNYVEGYGTNYEQSSTTFRADFNQVYIGGGLVDLRAIQTSAEEAGNQAYSGVAKVIEAINMSFAADNWGDIPYTDVRSGSTTPNFDQQLAVYDTLQLLLDEAITDLGTATPGPGATFDLVYAGDKEKWIRAAYTLKARLYIHTAEVRGQPAYEGAIAAATLGISDSVGGDLRALHGGATSERNLWFQFSFSTFGQYLKAGAALVELMKARGDNARLAQYFSPVAPGQYVGYEVNSASNPAVISEVATNPPSTRITDTYRQPFITWDENQLILAEARFQTAGAGAAQAHLDAVRAHHGLPSVPATIQAIAEEQYVTYFQNIEAWHSYKRHCYPNLTPSVEAGKLIPARLYYGDTELSANPNTPDEGAQDANGGVGFRNGGVDPTGSTASPARNPNDPPGGTVNADAACLGQ
jgi:hypothetical protein